MPKGRVMDTSHKRTGRFKVLKSILPLLKMAWTTEPKYLLAIVGLKIIRSFIPLAILYIGKNIADSVIEASKASESYNAFNWQPIVWLVVAEMCLILLNQVTGSISSLLEAYFGGLYSLKTTVLLLNRASKLDFPQLEDPKISELLERARGQTSSYNLLYTLASISQSTLTLFSLSATVLLYAPWLLLLLVFSAFPLFLSECYFASQGYIIAKNRAAQNRLQGYYVNICTNLNFAKEVKHFDLSGWLIVRYEEIAARFLKEDIRHRFRSISLAWLLNSFGLACYYGAYLWLIYITINGKSINGTVFTYGMLIFVAGSFKQSRDAIQLLLNLVSDFFEKALYVPDFFHFLELKPKIEPSKNDKILNKSLASKIEFRGVSFRYPGSSKWILKNLSFIVLPGEKIAFVGENGAGKTTITLLLARLYDPDEGFILIDDIDIKNYDLKSLRQGIGVVFQDFARYDFAMRENIGVGCVEALDDMQRVVNAAEKSLADEVAARFPAGYKQMLGRRFEGGVNLSGGEWQRVALGRLYFRDASILVLDEPTSSIDPRSEFELFKRFIKSVENKTAILISHRFSTVRMANKIVVLEHGKIVESGTHNELLKNKGKYAELYELQASGYR